jgi:hypothetical protein
MDPLIAGRGFAAMFQLFAITQKLMGGERVHPLSDRAVVETVTSIFLQGVMAEEKPSAKARHPSAEPRAASREPRATRPEGTARKTRATKRG